MNSNIEKHHTTVVVQSDDVDDSSSEGRPLTKDEFLLAQLGYRQTFERGFGMLENWLATFTSMNFVSGMPLLFTFALSTGGPQAMIANWTMVGGLSLLVSLSLGEIAAAYPTAGGIYYWAYRLGGNDWGPFLAWLTGWWNWAGWVTVVPSVCQGGTNFLISALQIQYPNAEVVNANWFPWAVTSAGLIVATFPNIISQRVLAWTIRMTMLTFCIILAMLWLWLPVQVARHGHFQNSSIFSTFYNGINLTPEAHASDAYCWMIGILFGAWQFYGYDASVHCAEETKDASNVVARGMYHGTLWTWLLSIPTLCLILLCIQDLDIIIGSTFRNNWAEYLRQIIGDNGAITILVLCYVDTILGTAVCFMSAQRVTFAIARDGVLPKVFAKLTPKSKMPLYAGLLVLILSIAIEAAIIGSIVAFTALTAMATIAVNFSYLIPIVARHTVGRRDFVPARWNLASASPFIGLVAAVWISFMIVILALPQLYPVSMQNLNYAPIMIGGVSAISLLGWILPFGYGARSWFKGPQRYVSVTEMGTMRINVIDET